MELDEYLAQILNEEAVKVGPTADKTSLLEDLNNMYDCWTDGEDIRGMLTDLVECAQYIDCSEYVVKSACQLWNVECDLSTDESQMITLHHLNNALTAKP